MSRKTFKITKLTKQNRWQKKYRGKSYYFALEDYPTAEVAWRAWLQKKTELDLEAQASKPHRAEYDQAISGRQELSSWAREQEDRDLARLFEKEAQVLLDRFNKTLSPPPLTPIEADPLAPMVKRCLAEDGLLPDMSSPVAAEAYQAIATYHPEVQKLRLIWKDRVGRRKAPVRQTLQANVDSFLARKTAQANAGMLSNGRVANIQIYLTIFAQWFGESSPVDNITGKTLEDFHTHLLSKITDTSYSRAYAHDTMGTLKQFVRWASGLRLCRLPDNILSHDLAFEVTPRPIETFTEDEVTLLVRSASSRTRLYCLLALNTGMLNKDIADLKKEQIDWEQNTLTRKRGKTKRFKNVPTVTYPLWSSTLALLEEHLSDDSELVLTNAKGDKLKRDSLKNGKYEKTDNIHSAFDRLRRKTKITKPFDRFRKTAATKLGEHPVHRESVESFLGHAPSTVAKRHYEGMGQDLFNEAVQWLGDELDLATL